MRNLIGKVSVALALVVGLSSCNKDSDNTDYLEEYKKQEQQVADRLAEQKVKIEQYVTAAEAENPALEFEPDSINVRFNYIDSKVKRGLWYAVEQEGDGVYEYKFNSSMSDYIYPTVKLKYTATLLDGTVVESDQTGTGTYNFSAQSQVFNNTWFLSFYPYSIRINGKDEVVGGLTKDGLTVGSKITVVTPSIYAYGATAKEKIPANSPLVYHFEVLAIN